MANVTKTQLPPDSLLQDFMRAGHYTDCYQASVPHLLTLSQYLQAFYSGRLFACERMILSLLANKPSDRSDIEALAAGTTETFAAWSVEARTGEQILLCDYSGKTRSWLMCCQTEEQNTQLLFGSVVISAETTDDLERSLPWIARVLMPFHRLYSRALIGEARRQLMREL